MQKKKEKIRRRDVLLAFKCLRQGLWATISRCLRLYWMTQKAQTIMQIVFDLLVWIVFISDGNGTRETWIIIIISVILFIRFRSNRFEPFCADRQSESLQIFNLLAFKSFARRFEDICEIMNKNKIIPKHTHKKEDISLSLLFILFRRDWKLLTVSKLVDGCRLNPFASIHISHVTISMQCTFHRHQAVCVNKDFYGSIEEITNYIYKYCSESTQ